MHPVSHITSDIISLLSTTRRSEISGKFTLWDLMAISFKIWSTTLCSSGLWEGDRAFTTLVNVILANCLSDLSTVVRSGDYYLFETDSEEEEEEEKKQEEEKKEESPEKSAFQVSFDRFLFMVTGLLKGRGDICSELPLNCPLKILLVSDTPNPLR